MFGVIVNRIFTTRPHLDPHPLFGTVVNELVMSYERVLSCSSEPSLPPVRVFLPIFNQITRFLTCQTPRFVLNRTGFTAFLRQVALIAGC
jgi:hypothetical protein